MNIIKDHREFDSINEENKFQFIPEYICRSIESNSDGIDWEE